MVSTKRRRLLGFLGTTLFILGLLGYTGLYIESQKIEASRVTLPFVGLTPVPVDVGDVLPPELTAVAGIVIDYDSGSVLFEKNANTYYPPASTTKLITALVVLDVYSPESELTIGEIPPVSGSVLGIRSGEVYRVQDLLDALLITSANDVALAFATAYPGGSTVFVEDMNKKAAALGLQDSVFSNPAGFDFGMHHSTAIDLAKIARAAWEAPALRTAMSTRHKLITDRAGNKRHELVSTNMLLHEDNSVLGGKTGTTEKAGEVLILLENRLGHTILAVVLGSTDRYSDTTALIDWLYENYTWLQPTPPHLPKAE